MTFFFSFSFSFPFPFFSLKHQGLGGLQAARECGMFIVGRSGGYQVIEVVSRLERQGGVSNAGFQRRGGELGRLEEATTWKVAGL